MTSERGTALITVLWVVLVISIVSMTLAASVRMEVASEMESFDSERAFFMAKGAAEVVYDSFSKKRDIPDGGPIRKTAEGDYVFSFDAGEAHVHFSSESGLIDLNTAPDQVLASMFGSLGVTEELRNRLVDSLLDWRDVDDIPHLYGAEVNDYSENTVSRRTLPANRLFENVDELLRVKNMTPELFYGTFAVDSATGQYRHVPGVRELVTVHSGLDVIDVNEASYEVLTALPSMTAELAKQIAEARAKKRFSDMADLVKRLPVLEGSSVLPYLSTTDQPPTVLVSRATIKASGASRTVRILFKREKRVQMLSVAPLIYRIVFESKFDRWRFD